MKGVSSVSLAPESQTQGFLPGLHGFRFLAAFLVFVHHLEQAKMQLSLASLYDNKTLEWGLMKLGHAGVTAFFVLSGFLITLLLLREHDGTGTINVKRFYVRRVLRIWPVYFVVTLGSFGVLHFVDWLAVPSLPQVAASDYWPMFALAMVFLPHLSLGLGFEGFTFAGPMWSTGVEETFYLLWAPLVKRFAKYPTVLCLGTMAIFMLLHDGVHVLADRNMVSEPVVAVGHAIANFINWFRIDCMAIGGWVAVKFHRDEREVLRTFYSYPIQLLTLLALALALYHGIKLVYLNDAVYSILFASLIVNLAGNPRSILKLRGKVFHYLGEISYGLYAYQWFTCVVAIKLVLALGFEKSSMAQQMLVTTLACGFTFGLSALSYHYMERPILRLKEKLYPRPKAPARITELAQAHPNKKSNQAFASKKDCAKTVA